ncbi:hypothetical protein E2C01_092209 [Portunus trituberculatus]|uniref:Uncharacterized protein n=1 Tax=Portunus trituberculatus TaxID=210409 RepID=A0A5B7JUV7_PORTR|nr:hypothetical protein [Portunus trituberculatus]
MLCYLWDRKQGIEAEREGAKRKQHAQAEKMQLVSTMRFKKAEVGDTVMVPIPLVDRGRAQFNNAKAVVLKVNENGTYLQTWNETRDFETGLRKESVHTL